MAPVYHRPPGLQTWELSRAPDARWMAHHRPKSLTQGPGDPAPEILGGDVAGVDQLPDVIIGVGRPPHVGQPLDEREEREYVVTPASPVADLGAVSECHRLRRSCPRISCQRRSPRGRGDAGRVALMTQRCQERGAAVNARQLRRGRVAAADGAHGMLHLLATLAREAQHRDLAPFSVRLAHLTEPRAVRIDPGMPYSG